MFLHVQHIKGALGVVNRSKDKYMCKLLFKLLMKKPRNFRKYEGEVRRLDVFGGIDSNTRKSTESECRYHEMHT